MQDGYIISGLNNKYVKAIVVCFIVFTFILPYEIKVQLKSINAEIKTIKELTQMLVANIDIKDS